VKVNPFGFFPVLSSLPFTPGLTRPVLAVRVEKSMIPKVMGLNMKETPSNDGHFTGSPDYAEFKLLLSLGPEMTRTGPGAIQHDAYMAFWTLSAIAGGFLSFSDKVKDATDVFSQGVRAMGNWQKCDKTSVEIQNIASGHVTTMDELKCPLTNGIIYVADGSPTPVFGVISSTAKLSVAHISHSSSFSLYTDPENGAFFKYFNGLVEPDHSFLSNVVQQHFFSLLGKDAEQASQLMRILRDGMKSLVHTEGGQELSHLFLGISLCIQSKAKLSIAIRRGRYQGFVLYGHFDFFLRGKQLHLSSWKDVRAKVNDVLAHERALQALSALMASFTLDDGSQKYLLDVSSIKTSYNLRIFFQGLSIEDFTIAQKKTVLEEVDKLDFADANYLGINLKDLGKFLQFVRDGDLKVFEGYSSFVGDGQILHQGRVSVGLSFFGKYPPSISYGRGKGSQVFQIPHKTDGTDPNLVVEDGKRKMQYFPVKRVIISEAINDWNAVISNGKLRFPPRSESDFVNSKLRDSVIGGVAFAAFYKDVRDTYVAIGKDNAEGTKRKADDIGEGRAAKKGKAARENAKKIGSSIAF